MPRFQQGTALAILITHHVAFAVGYGGVIKKVITQPLPYYMTDSGLTVSPETLFPVTIPVVAGRAYPSIYAPIVSYETAPTAPTPVVNVRLDADEPDDPGPRRGVGYNHATVNW